MKASTAALLDSDERYKHLLRMLDACGGYALIQQAHHLWGRSWSNNYRALLRLEEWGALRRRRVSRHHYCYLTTLGARYATGRAARRRPEPSHRQLITASYRLEWYLRTGRLLKAPLVTPRTQVRPVAAADPSATEATVKALAERWKAADQERLRLSQQLEQLQRSTRLGRAAAIARLQTDLRQMSDTAAALKQEHAAALAACERTRAATQRPQAAPAADLVALQRTLTRRCCFLDHSGGVEGLHFVLLDLGRSALWYREALHLLATVAGAAEQPWRVAVTCQDAGRRAIVERHIKEAMETSLRFSASLRQASSLEAKERLKRAIINPAPAGIRVLDLGLARYFKPVRGDYPALTVIWDAPLGSSEKRLGGAGQTPAPPT